MKPAETFGASRKKATTQPPMRWKGPQAAHGQAGARAVGYRAGRAAAKGERMAAIAERSESGEGAPRRSAAGRKALIIAMVRAVGLDAGWFIGGKRW